MLPEYLNVAVVAVVLVVVAKIVCEHDFFKNRWFSKIVTFAPLKSNVAVVLNFILFAHYFCQHKTQCASFRLQ